MARYPTLKRMALQGFMSAMICCLTTVPTFSNACLGAMSPAEKSAEMSIKEKEELVAQGVSQYEKGDTEKAKQTFQHAKAVFPSNYAVPYYLGLIYLGENRRADAINEWKQYVLMNPDSKESLEIRKYLTLLIRKEAVAYAKAAVANETALLSSPIADNTVAVTAFQNIGPETLGPLGKGLATMLISDLSKVPDLQVVERVKLQMLLQEMNLGTSGVVNEETAPKVGKLLKSRHVATGSLLEPEKESLQIFSAVVDTEQADHLDAREAQGKLSKFFDLEKTIACGIVEDLGRNCSDMPGSFYKVHTKSLAALSSFSIGLDYLDQEEYDRARAQFQKAVDEDPGFDLAKETLALTPFSAMLLLTSSQMVSALSSSAISSTAVGSAAAGSAVVGGGGVGVVGITTAAVVAGGAAVGLAAGGGGGGDSDDTDPHDVDNDGDNYTENQGDCNDSNRSIHPGAAEVCGDGVDQDCDGEDLTCSPNLTGNWIGTWTDSTGSTGEISLSITQTSTSVSGTGTIENPDCTLSGSLSGSVEGSSFQANISGTGSASFNANYTETAINGSLDITSGNCAGRSGTFSKSITGTAIIRW